MSLKNAITSPWALLALLLVGTETGRKMVRKAAVETYKVALVACDESKNLLEEAKAEMNQVIEEAKEERAANGRKGKIKVEA